MTAIATEHVLVVPTPVFHALGHFQGFCGDTDRYLKGLLDPAHTSYRPRAAMEQDPTFKQLIPYVIFRHRDQAGRVSLFQYTRGKGQGEARLHAKRSIGIGGHISAERVPRPGQGVESEDHRGLRGCRNDGGRGCRDVVRPKAA